jgi:pyridine nucleotide-disulfide oxidoreductase family protein
MTHDHDLGPAFEKGDPGMASRHLLLAGAGHAHLFVLERLAAAPRTDLEVTLVSPNRWQYYSGMLPGWLAGHYTIDDIRLDMAFLAKRAGARFLEDRIAAVDAGASVLHLATGGTLSYDLLSLDIGSSTDWTRQPATASTILTVKPLDAFVHDWTQLKEQMNDRQPIHLVVAGAGAAGVELAFSARNVLAKLNQESRVSLAAGSGGLLQGHAPSVRRRVLAELARQGIEILPHRLKQTAERLTLDTGMPLAADAVIAATGARAPAFLRTSGLALDEKGFIRVDACHRSLSHANVFAAGDIASRDDPRISRSGVHAVRAGPVLADNLHAALSGGELRAYRPRRNVLYLIACGRRSAILSWGRFSLQGPWVWRWKDWIDRRFIRRFSPPGGGA